LEPHFEATRNDPDPKKIPRAYFDLLNLCAKFQSHISTENTSNPSVKNTPKCMIWTSLDYYDKNTTKMGEKIFVPKGVFTRRSFVFTRSQKKFFFNKKIFLEG
jgi:hypothetical protein